MNRLLLPLIMLMLATTWGLASAQEPPALETNEFGYSIDGQVWTYQNVTVSSTGITSVCLLGDTFYVIGSEYTGPLPKEEGAELCWCSVNNPPGESVCKCGNYCAINQVSGSCNTPY